MSSSPEHSIHISHTVPLLARLPYSQPCLVNVIVSRTHSVKAEVAPGDFQVIVMENHYIYPIQPLCFSFDDIRTSRCYSVLEQQLLRYQPRMHPTTIRFLIEKIVDYGRNLLPVCINEDGVEIGFDVDVRLQVEHFRIAGEEELALYRWLGNMDDVEAEDDMDDDEADSRFKGVKKGIYDAGDSKGEVITCSVCLEDLRSGMEFNRLPCSHIFHSGCIGPWLERNRSCPNCRAKLEDKKSIVSVISRLMRFLHHR